MILNVDFYPEENSWELINNETGVVVMEDNLISTTTSYELDICVDYASCYTLNYYDSFGDGICCFGGDGNFSIIASDGTVLVANDGDFGSEANEVFCPNDLISSIEEIVNGDIKVFPNPTNGSFVIEIDDALYINDNLSLEVYNSIGVIVTKGEFVKYSNNQQALISLDNSPAGNYFVRCYNNDFNKVVKIVKL